ncbi:lipoyl protein ligase domain-containing protein [Candidatus Poriferisodalis sp.]|uniref:lipoyl protein ligase domain-containing protein n=1 Tax=Candidatus Poriferisodalis sp. TaxID=3101277 RepID=UPI003B515A74
MRNDLVRRRSGGGLVWLDPAAIVWVDVFVPAGDPLWRSDVSEAFHWLGRRLAMAFSHVGVPASTYRGPYEAGPSQGLVCFASLGPGEVTAGGRKLVGVSQRRTREGSRFQCVAYERFELGPLASAVDSGTSDLIRDRAAGWAEFGVSNSPSEIARLLMGFITEHDA